MKLIDLDCDLEALKAYINKNQGKQHVLLDPDLALKLVVFAERADLCLARLQLVQKHLVQQNIGLAKDWIKETLLELESLKYNPQGG